ncbi:MAG: hypothetical protein J6R01_05810 [Alistipes sp.]|nr:hypothetical protein [Alistipes sp.]
MRRCGVLLVCAAVVLSSHWSRLWRRHICGGVVCCVGVLCGKLCNR